ncbi:hypothetical protein LMH87_005556 [Akanthomyces muscarius]|uniref:Uncharacterized protein n=1 Tax=Akanthomyces muscarius TaxID=2231603 RepID=A0A9W8UPE3_AKAMU|nr:hypothetical protein LMH87_005556 [Akanthomyces muscarius]KAJ4163852.1 hypothetical protein LMH87_005556 [Akanthomyces muscarius]
MSAIALSLDPGSMIGSKSGLSWHEPRSQHHQHHHFDDIMFGDDFSVVGQTSDGGTMSPISAKSSASSPSFSFAPDHHSLKRQQDRVRRDSRLNARLRRYSNSSYADSAIMSPTDTIGNLGLAVYNPTTHTTVPLIAESPQLMPTSSYMPSYSPTSSEHSHGYSLSYQQPLPQSYHLPIDYSNGYLGASEFGGMRTGYQPASSVPHAQESSLMHQMPPSPSATAPDASPSGASSSRPKPRCWDHGCNGRQFSTFSNLLRHQREKSGQAAKATCPNCGAEFTRTTARNGHMLHDKCKRRTPGSSSA